MPVSGTVANGDDVVYTQYNNLRTDALNLHALGDTLTISAGAITVTSSYSHYVIAAESGTIDDLVTITAGTGIAEGDIIVLMADAGDSIATTTAGNVERALTFTEDHAVVLRYDGSQWQVIGSSGCGWKPLHIPITAFRPSDSGGCAAISELDNNAVRAFDPDTDEQALINLDFPAGWSGKIKAVVNWIVDDANAGDVVWAIKTENAATGEVMGNAATTTLTANAAGETQYEFSGTAISAEHTAGADGENILLYLIRDADNGDDDYGSDAYPTGVMLYYLMYGDGIS